MSEPARLDLTQRTDPLTRIENDLLGAISEGVGNSVRVASMPTDPSQWDLGGDKTAVLLHYSSSSYAAADANTRVQQREARFMVIVMVRSLRGEGGAYETLHQVRMALQGRPIGGGTAVRMIGERLAQQSEGIWQWEMEIAVAMPAVGRPAAIFSPPSSHTHTSALGEAAHG